MNKNSSSEQGQALIIIGLGFIVFLAFVALAIDGGITYSDRRLAQAGSDAASLSGAGMAALYIENERIFGDEFNCDHPEVLAARALAVETAINHASVNGYAVDEDDTDGNWVEAKCKSEPAGDFWERYIDVTTNISETVHTGFLQIFFSEDVINRVQATVRVQPAIVSAHGYAIVALNEDSCQGHQDGLMLSGSITVDVTGGGLWSNGCLRGNGVALHVDADGNPIRYLEELECDPDGCPGFSPAPGQASEVLPPESYERPAPDCSLLGENQGKVKLTNKDHVKLSPGNYTTIEQSGGILELDEGLYCLTGGPNAMKITGGTLTGYRVTIYVEEGEVLLSGNADVTLIAPDDETSPLDDVLIYLAEGNTGAVELEGNSDTEFQGIIYAPDGFIEAKGVAGLDVPLEFSLQLIGHDVEVSGNADIDFNFNASETIIGDTEIDMWK